MGRVIEAMMPVGSVFTHACGRYVLADVLALLKGEPDAAAR